MAKNFTVNRETFRLLRKKAGLTQAELAEYLGVHGERTIRKWENGERVIPQPIVKLMLGLRDKIREIKGDII